MFRIVRASALILVLACTASAGETPNNLTGGPTPPPVPLMLEPDSDSYIDTADSFGETLLNLFESVLTLF
jgi:hypothetical protein